jgi:hypothetical protein
LLTIERDIILSVPHFSLAPMQPPKLNASLPIELFRYTSLLWQLTTKFGRFVDAIVLT